MFSFITNGWWTVLGTLVKMWFQNGGLYRKIVIMLHGL